MKMIRTRMMLGCVVLALVAMACSDDVPEETIPPATTTTTAPLETTTTTTTDAPERSTTTTTTTTTEPPGPVTFEWDIEDGSATGPSSVAVVLGQRVFLLVTADVEDEVHLHGYDVVAETGPSSAAVIEFEANVPGIFEFELENEGLILTMVEVS